MPLKDKKIIKIKKGDAILHYSLLTDENDFKGVVLLENEIDTINSFNSIKRKSEFYTIRSLRNKSCKGQAIQYTDFGAPFLKESELKISISHNKYYGVLAQAGHSIACDIEEIKSKTLKLASRFAREEELALWEKVGPEEVTIIWTIKESLFKLCDRKGIDFKKDLQIIGKKKDTYTCRFMAQDAWKGVDMVVQKIENNILCFNPKSIYES
jgi:4'-phosphopantetheinyl transferase EntD